MKVSVGRVLHVYSDLWQGPRPGIVSGTWGSLKFMSMDGVGLDVANVNTFADGTRDKAFLAFIRKSPSGNTLAQIPVFDGVLEDSIDIAGFVKCNGASIEVDGSSHRFVAVWPPRV